MITGKDVDHVALLGRLELTAEEKEMFTRQLNDILEHFRSLERLDTENVQPTAHVLPLQNVYREDQVGQHMSREDALSNCPDRDENYFKVPKIV
ncbi:Asp-tRNA(Asn)/Glu-tRNA(Gln) amidotransferase subunit GatC [Pelotomaculum isophthalicicum JI]|uniref:Aspartyl/glutamyl-tRNA(Asn/Gln) amidotransferase subunit C n=1 Tax=Pelotomaculum isophthalicicum JI TaxID=947010 RepID=A0A9X4JVC3_9FIRM|nr:Asp-tRNA(Asn)/Glu-tRNA(Gln) amidotransferase subunit GatC [Pelotomaculum isophthalicicum]MDF9407243.1 Asp-tRNA(Asn)/Glu-tRNA(Gln) amidotransferase subunit GatC [Pelotomaculum isophthalicicum JI]